MIRRFYHCYGVFPRPFFEFQSFAKAMRKKAMKVTFTCC